MKKNLFTISLLGSLAMTAQSAVIATQDFGVANFGGGVNTDFSTPSTVTTAPVAVTHTSAQGLTDLGFEAKGKRETTGGDFAVVAGELVVTNMGGSGVDSPAVPTVAEDANFGLDLGEQIKSAYVHFNTVDLTNFINSQLSLDIGLGSGGINGDDDLVVRLYLNGETTGTTIYDTRGQADGSLTTGAAMNGAAFTGGALTYNFGAGVTSAQLYLDMNVDSTDQGYVFDNVSFEGTAVPEPSSTALIGLGGLALILRRRK